MKIIKAFLTLIFAMAFGFLFHYNWDWMSQAEPIIFFSLRTLPFPIWAYLIVSMIVGGLFVTLGSLWDVLQNRKAKNAALRELGELKKRYESLQGSEDQDVAYQPEDAGAEELEKGA